MGQEKSIALKVYQEEDGLSLNGEDVNDVALMTKTIKKLFNNKREFRRGGPTNNQFSNSIKTKENRIRNFNNFQITWNDCNSDGEIEEESEKDQMAFVAIRDDEISSNYSSDDENDDNIEAFVVKLYDGLKESYAKKKKDLKITTNVLLKKNLNFFQQNKMLKKKNDDLKKLKDDIVCNQSDLKKKLDKKTKVYEKIKEEQILLRKRINDLSDFLKKENQGVLKRKKIRNTLIDENFTTYRKVGLCFVRFLSCEKYSYLMLLLLPT